MVAINKLLAEFWFLDTDLTFMHSWDVFHRTEFRTCFFNQHWRVFIDHCPAGASNCVQVSIVFLIQCTSFTCSKAVSKMLSCPCLSRSTVFLCTSDYCGRTTQPIPSIKRIFRSCALMVSELIWPSVVISKSLDPKAFMSMVIFMIIYVNVWPQQYMLYLTFKLLFIRISKNCSLVLPDSCLSFFWRF